MTKVLTREKKSNAYQKGKNEWLLRENEKRVWRNKASRAMQRLWRNKALKSNAKILKEARGRRGGGNMWGKYVFK